MTASQHNEKLIKDNALRSFTEFGRVFVPLKIVIMAQSLYLRDSERRL
jgi:hypothetical protein